MPLPYFGKVGAFAFISITLIGTQFASDISTGGSTANAPQGASNFFCRNGRFRIIIVFMNSHFRIHQILHKHFLGMVTKSAVNGGDNLGDCLASFCFGVLDGSSHNNSYVCLFVHLLLFTILIGFSVMSTPAFCILPVNHVSWLLGRIESNT